MKQHLALDYTLGEGWLSPWTQGLGRGIAMASECTACGDVQFPPMRACPSCRAPAGSWRTLSGVATIVHRTQGADGDVALVMFEGASRGAIVRTDALPPDATRGQLAPWADGPPVLSLIPEASA